MAVQPERPVTIGSGSPSRLVGIAPAESGPGRRLAVAGLSATVLSFVLTCTVALAGPSLVEPALSGAGGQPPWSLDAHPSPYLIVALSAAGIVAAVTGLAFILKAIRHGWSIPASALVIAGIAGATVLAFLPPFGSSDHLSYAAYGRMAITGHNPFTTTPADLARLGDPVARAVQDWRTSPSVYGPLAVAGQALAAWIGGTSVRLIVFVLSLLNVLAFALTGLILHWLGRGDPARQLRAAVLWTANPLMLMILVGGAHVDSQAIVFGVGAVALAAAGLQIGRPDRTPGLVGPSHEGLAPVGLGSGNGRWALIGSSVGVLIGLGFAIKVTTALVGTGIAMGLLIACATPAPPSPPPSPPERSWVRWIARSIAEIGYGLRKPSGAGTSAALGGMAAGFCGVAGLALIPWGTRMFGPALRAGSYTSVGSPWRAVRSGLRLVIGENAAEDLVKVGALLLCAILVVLLINYVRRTNAPPVAAVAFAVVFAWLLAWPYVLPWYDGLGWALLAVLPASGLDWLMLARSGALALGYLPARGVRLPAGLGWLETVVRTAVTPAVLLAVVALAVFWLWPTRANRLAAS
jgi:hypothetical protein